MKTLKLSLVGLVTVVLLVALFVATDPQRRQQANLCWNRAVSLISCYTGPDADFVVNLDGVKYEGNTSNYIEGYIFYYGAYEKPNLYLLRDLMRSIYAGKGVFIDIGANTGQHSLFISQYAKEVHAFEPWEPVLKKFRRNIAKNGVKNIFIHAYGLGDENAKKPFFKPPDDNLVTGSFVEGFKPANSLEGELEIQKGDEAFAKEGIKSVSVIKIDIEGYEKLALRGLQATLNTHRPVIVFELTIDPKSPVSIKTKAELISLFPTQYDFLVISKRSDPLTGKYFLEPIDGNVNFDAEEQDDLIAYPTERKNSIARQGPIN